MSDISIQPGDLESYLHEHIPLSKAMEVRVQDLQADSLTLAAPILPNINHRETVFGGSASALGILAAWSVVWKRMKEHQADLVTSIVIQRNSMEYQQPITTNFEVTCSCPDATIWKGLEKGLRRKGVGRVTLESYLTCGGNAVGLFTGSFVVFDMDKQ